MIYDRMLSYSEGDEERRGWRLCAVAAGARGLPRSQVAD